MKIRKIFNEGLDKFPSNINDINFGVIDSNDPEKDKFVAVTNAIDDWESENNKKGLTKNFRSTLATVILENGIDENNDFIKFVKEADDEVLKNLTAFGANSIIKFFNSKNFKDDFWKELIEDNNLVKGSAQDVAFKLNVVNEIISNAEKWVDASGTPIKLDQLKSNGKYLKASDIKAITDKYAGEAVDSEDNLEDGITFEEWLKNNNYTPPYDDKSKLQQEFTKYIQNNSKDKNVQTFASDISQTLEQPKKYTKEYKELMSYKINKDEKDINKVFENIIDLTKLSKNVKKAIDGILLEEVLIIKNLPRNINGVKKYFDENIFKNLDKNTASNLKSKLDTFLSSDIKNLNKILELEFSSITLKVITSQLISLLK